MHCGVVGYQSNGVKDAAEYIRAIVRQLSKAIVVRDDTMCILANHPNVPERDVDRVY
ncbi:hypothetical protein FA15DRAFT_670059 [Coprinopsis marcescibilis]|uniref:Uncharacterized protein n=1 Tax=Coprinopsis marcescibilis TaxID=230819 RepID=A0A5C3KU26_COPMA|nr:hypothetical protein FA15DRAFT_670059 [Coprinopsis marcescibilis]